MASFTLHNTGASSASYAFVSDANNAFASLRSASSAPSGNRGPNSAYNKIVITQISVDVGGYSNTGSIYYGVWSSGGTTNYYASSPGQSIGAVGATSSVPTPTRHTVPTASRFELSGGTTYYFGVHNENTGGMTVQRTTGASGNLAIDESHSNPGSDLSGTGWDPDFRTGTTLIGTITYIYLPSKPLTPSATTGGKNQTTISWTAPADDGDSAITSYGISYKKSSDAIWTFGLSTTSLSYTLTGLDANTSYDVRVSAINAASDAITYNDTDPVTSDYSDTVTITTAPGGPPVWNGTSWRASEVFVCTSNGTWTGAAAASVFVCTNATPGSVVWTPIS
jgi:hypothetical protein